MRTGATLGELLIVMVVVAALAAVTVPSAAGLLARVYTGRAARELMAAHRVARFTAIVRSRPTFLKVFPESLVVSVLRGPDTLAVWRAAGPASLGVSLEGPGYPLAFAPTDQLTVRRSMASLALGTGLGGAGVSATAVTEKLREPETWL